MWGAKQIPHVCGGGKNTGEAEMPAFGSTGSSVKHFTYYMTAAAIFDHSSLPPHRWKRVCALVNNTHRWKPLDYARRPGLPPLR